MGGTYEDKKTSRSPVEAPRNQHIFGRFYSSTTKIRFHSREHIEERKYFTYISNTSPSLFECVYSKQESSRSCLLENAVVIGYGAFVTEHSRIFKDDSTKYTLILNIVFLVQSYGH